VSLLCKVIECGVFSRFFYTMIACVVGGLYDTVETVYLGDTGGALYDGQQQVLYWADVSTELAFVVPSPTSHALAAGKAPKCHK